MATLTKEQYEALKRQGRGSYRGQTSSSGQFIIEADKFVGDLQGNADTATRLRDPITISLGGDAEGSAQFAGSSFRLDATIRNSEHADNADTAENANHSAQASHADLANIATLALRSMLADNASHAEEASHADDSTHADSSDVSTLATRALHADDASHADEADNATFALKDSNGDNIHNTFVDKQSQITTNTNNIATHEGTLTNHEGRISQAESNISSLDTRVGNIETSTDVGRITQRIVNIEAKDVEQDGRLDAINDTMVTLSTAQYILAPKTFNAGSKTIMDNEAGATEITNKEYVDNKVLSSANYVTNYTDNKVLSASRYITDYVDNKVLSTAQYVDDNFMSLTRSQYVTGLNTFEQLPRSEATPTNPNDLITKNYLEATIGDTAYLYDKLLPTFKEDQAIRYTNANIIISTNFLIKINDKYYYNQNQTTIKPNSNTSWDNTSYATASNRAGKDFYIYALATDNSECSFILSANSTKPTGYTVDNSRKIGGFHCLCKAVTALYSTDKLPYYDQVKQKEQSHTLYSYQSAGAILPSSLWDLCNRAESENEGMVYDSKSDMWIDIYLASWSGTQLQSKYNAVIADGASSRPFHGELFATLAHEVKKTLISRDLFIAVAQGSNERTNIQNSADPNTTGGHVDTSGRRMISNLGLEDCCGVVWQWCAQSGGANGSSNWQNTVGATPVDPTANYFGQSYGAYYRALVGGDWGAGASCGSRCVSVGTVSADVGGSIGARLVAKRRIINFI